MLAHTFEVPVVASWSLAMGSNVHFSLPVCASTAKTEPGGAAS
jgi:hypothetical protein